MIEQEPENFKSSQFVSVLTLSLRYSPEFGLVLFVISAQLNLHSVNVQLRTGAADPSHSVIIYV